LSVERPRPLSEHRAGQGDGGEPYRSGGRARAECCAICGADARLYEDAQREAGVCEDCAIP